MDRNSIENKWIVDEGHQITGLVHPKTRAEAVLEMARLGIGGKLHQRASFENSARYKNIVLRDARANKQNEIRRHVVGSGVDFGLVTKLIELEVAISPPVVAMLDYAEAKVVWCETASIDEIAAYDPAADSDFPSI